MYKFADRTSRFSGSVIREILKFMTDPDIISLGGGSPANESFAIDTIQEIVDSLLTKQGTQILQYGITEGWVPLREAYLAHIARPKGVEGTLDHVITTTGATQGIMLASEAFLNEGDVVLVESPTFLATLMEFNKLNCRIIPVETDEQGMVMDDLEAKIKQYQPKMLYSIPTFQNPTGKTLPLERRKTIAKLAAQYEVIVMEDDPYCDLRYYGEEIPPIKAFDEAGYVILLNSFSKIVSPGLRVGTALAEPEIIKRMTIMKQCADTHTTNLTQAICAEFLSRGLLPDHLKKINAMYRVRLNAMLDAIDSCFPKECHVTRPEGGLFVWVKLPDSINASALLEESVNKCKVAFIPGNPFFVNEKDGDHFIRMNFSGSTVEQIDAGVRKVGELIKEKI